MKKLLLGLFLILTMMVYGQQDDENAGIFLYIPGEEEIQYYMNLKARLGAIEVGEMDHNQLIDFYDTFLKVERFRNTYQSLLLEAYLRYTSNEEVKQLVLEHIEAKGYDDEFSESLKRLYNSKIEYKPGINGLMEQANFNDKYYDERIDMFNMSEQYTFNGELGFMLFENDYAIFQIDPPKENTETISLNYGGGTNALLIIFTKTTSVDRNTFETDFLNQEYYDQKYENFKIDELPLTGILEHSGASNIFIGIGYGEDVFPEIENFSSVIYLYYEENQTAYRIDYFMNISEINNSFFIRNRMFNHLVFQNLLSFLNIE